MKRLFGKFSRPPSRPADAGDDSPPASPAVEAAAIPEEQPTVTARSESVPAAKDVDAPTFELREPTPEEMSATILSRQDFLDIDRMFAGNTPPRVIQRAKPPVLSPAVATPLRAEARVSVDVAPIAAPQPPVSPPPPAPEHVVEQKPEPAASAVPAPEPAQEEQRKTPLTGFLEGFVLGKSIGGWAGDPDDPGSRSLRVTAFVDGKEVASALADRDRKDTPYASFHIPFADPLIWQYVLEDRLTVQAARAGEEPVALRFLSNVLKQSQLAKDEHIAANAPAPQDAIELSYVGLPVGLESRNGTVIVGRDGFLFDHRDPTNLVAQYAAGSAQDEAVRHDASRWFALFRSRGAWFKARNIAYVQTILPEKATILQNIAPAGLGPITARLGIIEGMFDAEAKKDGAVPAAPYRSLISALRSCNVAGVSPYRRTASGLGAMGGQFVFYQLVQKISALLPDHAAALTKIADLCGYLTPGAPSAAFTGDLGAQFDLPIHEIEQLPDIGKVAAYAIGDPAAIDRKDGGSRFVWRNPNAPAPLKLMAFGISGFGTGAGPADLAWWFKAMFGEFHLIESADVDEAYVEQHRPDIVVAMSLERHLPTPPAR